MAPVFAVLAILVVLIIAVVAYLARKKKTPRPKNGCASAADCPAGASCVNDACVGGGCSAERPCPAGQACEGGACVGGGCKANAGCHAGQICRGGECVSGCRSPAECASGDTCAAGVCVAPACRTNAACPGGRCDAGTCVPGGCPGIACPSSQVCKNKACVGVAGGCKANSDCPKSQHCRDKHCVGGCLSASECPSGQECKGGSCQPLTVCTSAGQCGSGETCAKGACARAPKCSATKPFPKNKSFWLRNAGVDPTWAVGGGLTNDLAMWPSPSKLYDWSGQSVRAVPAGAPDHYYLVYHLMRGQAPMYIVRSLTDMAITVASSKTYSPSADPNATWLYEGGVLSDPGKTVILTAADCKGLGQAAARSPGAAKICKKQGPGFGAPFLEPYGPYDCELPAYIWTFSTA